MSLLKYRSYARWKRVTAAGLLFFSLYSAGWIFAQDFGKINGKVQDKRTGEPLYGANIIIKGTVLGTAADVNGRFEIEKLPAGTYDIEAAMMGYLKQHKKQVQILPGQKTEITFELEQTVLKQQPLVVTASKRKQYIEDASTSVDVISKREIQTRSVTNLDEVLQNTAGFGVIDGQIDLRGSTGFNWAAGSRVLVMVDGHPLISGDTGGINWDAIPVEVVERIEVVKGAGSALYGSNAMAGMVNIITREPTPFPETRYKLTWGFYDEPAYPEWRWTDRFLTYRIFEQGKFNPVHSLCFEGIDLSHSRRFGKVGMLLTAGRKRSSGYFQNGDYSRWNIMGKAKIKLSTQKSLAITGNWALNDHGDVIQWASQDSPMEVPAEELGNRVRYEKINFQSTFNHTVNQKLAYSIKANVYRCDWQNFFYDNEDYAITDRIGTEVQTDYQWGNQFLTFGTEITAHHTNSMIYGDHNTWDYSLYIEDELKFSPLWTLTLGSRYDYHIVKGVSSDQQFSPRMGLVFRPWEDTSIRLSAGHGFRAPSIAEVFANITVSGFKVVPNLDLKDAERAWSFELGIRQSMNTSFTSSQSSTSFLGNPFQWVAENINPSFLFDISIFYSRYKNMIDVDLNPDVMAFQFFNLGRARNQGVEVRITASTFSNHLTTTLGYTYVDPLDLDTEKMLNYRSRHRVVTGINLHLGRITLGLDYRYASRIEEVVNIFSSDERVPMHVMDARIILDLNSLQICLEGKNLKNYHYSLRQRLLEPIRNYVVTIRGKI